MLSAALVVVVVVGATVAVDVVVAAAAGAVAFLSDPALRDSEGASFLDAEGGLTGFVF